MTRRKIYFFDKENKKLYCTPEFNGDKSEFAFFRKRGDSCDKNFDEILKEFDGVKTLEDFKNASDKAQSYYCSAFVGVLKLPVEEVKEITDNDEIYMIDDKGKTYLYNPPEITREYVLDMCNRGIFKYKDLTMNVTKFKQSEKDYYSYKLTIGPIKNAYSGNQVYLGDFANDDKNANWGYEFNKNLNILIERIEKCKQNAEKEPLKMELVDLFNDEYKIAFKSKEDKIYGLSNGGDCIFLTTLDKKGNPENHILDYIDPILWNDKKICAMYLSSHNGVGYDKKDFDIPRIEMAYKLNSYMTMKEDILYSDTINKNLNDIYEDIYNRVAIEENLFQKYENENDLQELKNDYYIFLNDSLRLDIELEEIDENEI